jgi:hypothetical protein
VSGVAGKQFWAALPGDKGFVTEVKLRARRYFEAAEQLGLVEQWREADAVYNMRDRNKLSMAGQAATKLDLGTRKDPRVSIRIPEARSLARQQLAFLMAEKTSFQCVATTGETKSVLNSELAEKAVNYAYEQHCRPSIRTLGELAIEFGAAATHLRWDAAKGDDVIEQVPVEQWQTQQQSDGNVVQVPQTVMAQRPAKSGAPYCEALSPLEYFCDPVLGVKAGWIGAFERTNLYALAGEYPEQAEQLLNQPTHDEFMQWRLNDQLGVLGANDGDVMAIHFYYADRPELPKGRYCLIVGELVVLDVPQCPLGAGRLPVRPLLTSKFADSAFSFADFWGYHAIEEALNRIRSASLTNSAYHGNQARWMEEGTRVEQSSGEARTYIVPRGGQPPAAIEIKPMPAATPDVVQDLISALPRVSGFSDVSRGTTVEKTTSGAHANVFEAITARNLSLTEGDLRTHEEELANDLIEMISRYANTAFVAEIAGREGSPVAKTFAPQDFTSIRRVRAKAVPDAMRGPLARLSLLEQTKDIEDPRERAKAVQMVLRGDDEYGKNDARQINLIASENERLIAGPDDVEVSPSDDDVAHMLDHRAALDLLRTQDNADPQAIMRFATHMMGHSQNIQTKDPVMAQMLGQMPPPILPGNPAFMFQQRIQQAQMMLGMSPGGQPPGADPNAPPGEGAPANDQQPAPEGAPSEAAE